MSNNHHKQNKQPAPKAAEPQVQVIPDDEIDLLAQRAAEAAKDNPDQNILDDLDKRLEALKANEPPAAAEPQVGNAEPPAVLDDKPIANDEQLLADVAAELADYKMVDDAGLFQELIEEMDCKVNEDGQIVVADLNEASTLLRDFLDRQFPKEDEPHVSTTRRNQIRTRQSDLEAIGGGTLAKKADLAKANNNVGVYNGKEYPRWSPNEGHNNWDWGIAPDGSPVKVSFGPTIEE